MLRESRVIQSFYDMDLTKFDNPLITVYEKPKDFEGHYVARLFSGEAATEYCVLAHSFEGIQKKIPKDLVSMDRQEEDDPVIVGVFI